MSKRTFEAWHTQAIFDAGMGHVLICRHKPSGITEAGVFLVDLYCLGAKGAFYAEFPTSRMGEKLDQIFGEGGRTSIGPACARKLIEDALTYARNLGFAPHPDYKKAARVLGGLNSRECETTFTFGRNGKPFYIAGPHDSPHFQRLVHSSLLSRVGQGNFDFAIGGPVGGVLEGRELEPENPAPPPPGN